MKQLSLPVLLDDECTFANFFPGNNRALLDYLSRWLDVSATNQEHFVFLWGTRGAGCTHLLQATCRNAQLKQMSHCYIHFKSLNALDPSILEDLETIQVIALDNIQTILGNLIWEEALFNCYNRVRECGGQLIVSSDTPPPVSDCRLEDLRSRLSWGLTWHVHALNDAQKIAALLLRAQNRGLLLPKEVAQFLLNRYPRNMDFLISLLEQLDQAALSERHRLTLPFVKKVLKFTNQ